MKTQLIRVIAVVLCMAMFIPLVSCNGDNPQTSTPESTVPEIPVRTTPLLENCDWYTVRGDYAHTSNSLGVGDFISKETKAEVDWTLNLGDGDLPGMIVLDVNKDGKDDVLYSYAGSIIAMDNIGNKLWESKNFSYDIRFLGIYQVNKNGDDVLAAVVGDSLLYFFDPENGRCLTNTGIACFCHMVHFADFLPETPGLEVLLYQGGKELNVTLYSFSKNYNGEKIWTHTYTLFKNYVPEIGVGDYNNDGTLDVFYAGYSRMAVLNGQTGEMISKVDYLPGGSVNGNGRNYGEFFVSDVNNDGYDDIVMVGRHYNEHAQVTISNGTKLTRAFDIFHEFDAAPAGNNKSLMVWMDSCADIDGDDLYEIVYSVYNDDGEHKWQTYIVDASSSRLEHATSTRQVIDNQHVWGIWDLDNDGIKEIITTTELNNSVSKYSTVNVYKYNGSEYVFAASYENAGVVISDFAVSALTHAAHYNTRLRAVYGDVNNVGKDGFVVACSDGSYKLLYFNGNALEIGATYSVLPTYIKDLDGDGKDEVFAIDSGICKVISPDLSLRFSFELGGDYNKVPVAADLDKDGSLEIIVAGASKVVMVKSNAAGQEIKWSVDGYGSRNDKYVWSALIAPVGNNGELRAVFGTPDKDTGESRISVYKADGTEEWGYTFEGYHNNSANLKSGIYQYTAGDVTGDGKVDLIVFLMRGSDYTEGVFVIDGKTHELIFKDEGNVSASEMEKPVSNSDRAAGPMPSYATVADIDGDGMDELVLNSRDYYLRYEMVDGKFKRSFVMTTPGNIHKYYHDESMLVKVGETYYNILTGSPYHYGVMDMSANLLWQKSTNTYSANYLRYNAFTDVDGDGNKEVIMAMIDDGKVTVMNFMTGEIENLVNASTDTYQLVSADLDGDGRGEVVYSTVKSNSVIALNLQTRTLLNQHKESAKIFELALRYRLGNVMVADADGDDLLEVLVCSADGKLYCINSVAKEAK